MNFVEEMIPYNPIALKTGIIIDYRLIEGE